MRSAFALALCAALAWQAWVLFVPVASIRASGKNRYEIKEFAAGAPVGQTFRARTDGLHSATVWFSSDQAGTVQVTYRLMGWSATKVPDHWAPVIEGREIVRLSPGSNAHTFSFKAIADSARQVYQFQIQQEAAPPSDGAASASPAVGVMASTDDALDEGNLIVGTAQIVDRDLVFDAAGADSRFDDFRMRISPQLPRNLRSPAVQWTAGLVWLAVYNWALAAFAMHLLGAAIGRSA